MKMQQQIQDLMRAHVLSLDSVQILEMFDQIEPGKMFRARLMLKIDKDKSKRHGILQACALIELIQLASLLHDDVIDSALTRRAKSSINALFGNKNAIMLGDALYSLAFLKMLDLGKDISKSIANSVVRLSRGEILDVFMAQDFQSQQELYFSMIGDKTASLFGAACEVGALFCKLDPKKYYELGFNLGLCFQIVDDVLDLIGDEKTLGKPVLSDFKDGKSTLPYILLHQKLDPINAKKLRELRGSNNENAWILEQMQRFEILEQSISIAKDYASRALSIDDSFSTIVDYIFKHLK